MIGGNIQATLQIKKTEKNEIGESVESYEDYQTLKGFIDFMSGSADTVNYNAKLEETTHVFICDYVPISLQESECRMMIKSKPYEVTFIDNPMELNQHLEIFLKYVGD